MFTKKLEDQFSADLLNTVKGILGEAKHDKECECEKCEEEDDEDEDEKENGKEDKKKEMKEGSVPTSDEPTEHDKKVAQKVRDLLAKEKKSMKEEKRGLWANIHAKRKRIKAGSGERMRKPGSKGAPTAADFKASQTEEVQIDELSDATLKSYSRKALDQSKTLTGDQKVKRQVGARNAIDRLGNNTLAKEEVEIEEASTAEKNKQYIEITHLLGHKRRVPVHPTNAYKALNRYRNDPSTKSARIVSEEIELEEGKMKDLVTKHMDAGHDYETALKKAKKDLDIPFEGPYKKPGVRKDQYGNVVKNVAKHLAKKAMAKEEVEHPTKAKNYENNIKIIKNEHQKLLKKGYNYIGSTNSRDHMGINTNHYYVSPNNDHIHHMSYANYSLKDTDNIKKYDKLKHNKIENTGAHAHFKEHVVEDYSHILDEARGRSRKKFDKTILEEVEQIDEIGDTPAGKRALGRYIKDRRGTILGAGMGMEKQNKDRSTTDKQRKDLGRKASNAFTGVARAVDRLTKEEQEFIDALNNDTLEEGRGRPPKEGSAAWHAKQQKDNDDMPALGVQLRKAKSMNKKVRFMDGKEHEIHPNHADRFEDHMAARKSSQEKAAFQKQAHKSHADFVKAVSAPVPKASKDTGEIVKYRH